MLPEDWPRVAAIYREGIKTGSATFETDVPSWEEWDCRHFSFARLVFRGMPNSAESNAKEIVGWAALSPVSTRLAYAGVAEVSVYVAEEMRGFGIGKVLLQTLLRQSEENGIWTLQAGIFPENQASLALHVQCGFREVGRRERIGQLHGEWRDTVLLERRSAIAGV